MHIMKNSYIWLASALAIALHIGGGFAFGWNLGLAGILIVLGLSSTIWAGYLIRGEYLVLQKIKQMLRTREWACVYCSCPNFAVLKEMYTYVSFGITVSKDERCYSEDRGDYIDSFICVKCGSAAPKELVVEMAMDVSR